MKTSLPFLFFILIFGFSLSMGQNGRTGEAISVPVIDTSRILEISNAFIHAHLGEWGLTESDIAGMRLNKLYTDKTTGVTRIYFLQQYKNIPVNNAVINLSITQEGNVFFYGNRFVRNLSEKVNTSIPLVKPQEALIMLAAHYGLPAKAPALKRQNGADEYIFDKGEIASEDIVTNLRYQPRINDVVLSWNVMLSPIKTHDKWNARVNAITGQLLTEFNWTVYCKTDGTPRGNAVQQNVKAADLPHIDDDLSGAQYNVWPAPVESPNHGLRSVVTNPHNLDASPFGWHDIDGLPGADFTITRGNNCYAFQDRDGSGSSSNDEPDGGPSLHFDAPYDPDWEPEQYTDASVINLFYWTNYMHDFAYPFGFDEAAGNFQVNNYGNGGFGGDPILTMAQSAADVGYQGNPHYRHNNDGGVGAIYMEESDRIQRALQVHAPLSVSDFYVTELATTGWGDGAYVTTTPVTGEVVIALDGIEEPFATDACEALTNSDELAGKIVLIDRGGCEFGFKAWQAQNAGAIGVIICRFDDVFEATFGPGAYGAAVQIPVVMISYSDAQRIRQYAGNNLIVSLVRSGSGPENLDVSLDNGFLAHEYGHGIMWRLAGGPDAICIDNVEQMDEGWSDFFAIATTVRPGDTGNTPRGIGTYIYDEPNSGTGNRRYAYSTDMTQSPLTYADLAVSYERHDVGEIWCNVLWDIYWALVDVYGYNESLQDVSSGNHKAIRLVFDAMKNLPCLPGFVDGRDAMLAVDQVLYGGANRCLLWKAFARRGLGLSADQGSPLSAGDQKAAFDVPPQCADQLIVEKVVTDFIQPGEPIEVSINVRNLKNQPVTNVIVTDELPDGTTFQSTSSPYPVSVQGNIVTFMIGDMQVGQELAISYVLTTPSNAWSVRHFLDDVPDATNSMWHAYSNGENNWSITNAYPAHSGNYAWFAKEEPVHLIQSLELNSTAFSLHVEGDNPALRFYHRYLTRTGLNGGVIEVREAGTATWRQMSSDFIRNGYPGYLLYTTFAIPNLSAFSGNNGTGYEASYIDLSYWKDKYVQIRFRFGTDVDTIGGMGWLIDDIEYMDLLSYNGEVCVTTDQGDLECVVAPEGGTIVESKEDISSGTNDLPELPVLVYPNPTSGYVNVLFDFESKHDVVINLQTPDGRQVFKEALAVSDNQLFQINVAQLPAGLYFLHLQSNDGQHMEKIVIQNNE